MKQDGFNDEMKAGLVTFIRETTLPVHIDEWVDMANTHGFPFFRATILTYGFVKDGDEHVGFMQKVIGGN